MLRKQLLFFLLLCVSSFVGQAQSSDSSAIKAAEKVEVAKEESISLNTEESIDYLSSELWFQVKKRLHLTSKEEEEEQAKKKGKKFILSIGGIKIE